MSFGEERCGTVIVGAGPAGLSMAGALRKAGQPFIVLERAQAVGPAWRHHYERLHLHTVRDHSGLAHFPMDKLKYPVYLPRAQVVDYLESYAREFGLEPRFGQDVKSVRREGGQWVTTTGDTRYVSERVIMASGYNRVPLRPTYEGQESFAGRVLHSSEYRNGAPFKGKRVLVVGIGNTGGEIAIDLHEHGATPFICVRGPINVVSRDAFGTPSHVTALRLQKVPPVIADWIFRVSTRLFIGDLSKYGIELATTTPREDIEKRGRVPLIDIGTIDLIKRGHLKVVPGIRRFQGQTIEFVDGSTHEFDDVVLATGYRGGLSDFLGDISDFADEKGYPVPASGECRTRPGLYFIGFANPTTGFLRQISMDSIAIAGLLAAQ